MLWIRPGDLPKGAPSASNTKEAEMAFLEKYLNHEQKAETGKREKSAAWPTPTRNALRVMKIGDDALLERLLTIARTTSSRTQAVSLALHELSRNCETPSQRIAKGVGDLTAIRLACGMEAFQKLVGDVPA